MQKTLIFLALCAALAGAGCSPHKIEIQQGNVITAEKLKELKVGMDERQVRFLLGTPLLQDPFHANRWDYYYEYAPSGKRTEQYRISLYFEGGRLARIEPSGAPPATDYLHPVQKM